MTEPMRIKNCYMPQQLISRLTALAKKRGTPEAEIIREALRIYLEKQGG